MDELFIYLLFTVLYTAYCILSLFKSLTLHLSVQSVDYVFSSASGEETMLFKTLLFMIWHMRLVWQTFYPTFGICYHYWWIYLAYSDNDIDLELKVSLLVLINSSQIHFSWESFYGNRLLRRWSLINETWKISSVGSASKFKIKYIMFFLNVCIKLMFHTYI